MSRSAAALSAEGSFRRSPLDEGRPVVLVVDDDPGLLRLVERALGGLALVTESCGSGEEALAWLEQQNAELLLVDFKLADLTANALLDELERRGRKMPFIVMTGFGDERVAVEMMKRGARDYLMKDAAFLDLLPPVVEQALAQIEQERRLARAETSLSLLGAAMLQAKDGVLITDANLEEPGPRIVYANPALSVMTGFTEDEIVGSTPRLFQGPKTDRAELSRMRSELAAGRDFYGVLVNYDRAGRAYDVELHIGPIRDGRGQITHFVAIERDITARRKLEASVRERSKMEAIGGLAGGIAHDFNNMLAVICGNAELLLSGLDEGDRARESLQAISSAGEHATRLTRQLLAFSRRQVLKPVVLDLNGILDRAGEILRHAIPRDVELDFRFEDELVLVKADPSQMEQVILNLAINGRDAMPSGGQLTLSLDNLVVGDDGSGGLVPLQPGRWARFAVEDTGSGIDPDRQQHVFEPFYTTKPQGEGTGLGLATVYGIVKQSGGEIGLCSAAGAGTRFEVYLPETRELGAPREAPDDAPHLGGATELVLVVEDEELVRKLVEQCLRGAGYRVLTAADGVAALEVWSEHEDTIDALVTDVVMPRMNGTALAEKIHAKRPELPILFMSGYASDHIENVAIDAARTTFVAKPFSPGDLKRSLRELLGGDAAGTVRGA